MYGQGIKNRLKWKLEGMNLWNVGLLDHENLWKHGTRMELYVL